MSEHETWSLAGAWVKARFRQASRLADVREWVGARPALRLALAVYVPMRIVLSLMAGVTRVLVPLPAAASRPYLGSIPLQGVWRGPLLGVWQRWDTLWYMLIAREGYGLQDTRVFAPPLFPGLMGMLGRALGGGEMALLVGGLIVSNVAAVALFAYLYRLFEMEWGAASARRSVIYLALFPTAFFLLAAYAESLFLLCVVAAFYHARRGEWVWAGTWGFFAPLARLPGAVILLPLGWEFVRQEWARKASGRRPQWQRGWPLGLVMLGGLAFPLYVHLVLGADGLLTPYAIHTQRFMGRFAWPWESLWAAMRILIGGRFRAIEPFDLACAVLFIILAVATWRTQPRIYGLYMAVMLCGALTKVGEVQPLLSLSRYVLVLFPGFVALAQWSDGRPWRQRAVVYMSSALSLFFVGQFAIWGWVG